MLVAPHSMILGTGCSVPEKILTNADLERIVDTSDRWITERTGIKQRHVAEPGTPLSQIAVNAARQALENADTRPEEIDMIILGTVTGDMMFPATACILQEMLGAKNASAFDLSAACSGFIYGLHLADSLLRSGGYRRILLVAGEILTCMVNWEDRDTCVLFGDGAGAAVLGPASDGKGVLYSGLGADGSFVPLLYNPGCGSLSPPTEANVRDKLATIRMEGREVFRHALTSMGGAMEKAFEATGLQADDLALLIPHQANLRIIEGLAKRTKIPMDKVYVNVDRYGNTSAASIPIALDEVLRSGLVREGDRVGLVSFGAGFTWGATILQF